MYVFGWVYRSSVLESSVEGAIVWSRQDQSGIFERLTGVYLSVCSISIDAFRDTMFINIFSLNI